MDVVAKEAMIEALLHISVGDHQGALSGCAAAADADPTARLPPTLMRYLELGESDVDGSVVYREPSAFESFIEGGDNPALYAATIAALQRLRPAPDSLIDIGCGDGRVTAATVGSDTRRLALLEPSAVLLDQAVDAVLSVANQDCEMQAINAGIETLVDAINHPGWQRAQATFAFHTVEPLDRLTALSGLAEQVATLAVVEFDVAPFADRSEDHARYVVDRYEQGLAEYDPENECALGFLMPVLVGQFDPAATRHTWEQPISGWCQELATAGFTDVSNQKIHDYWWAPAHLVVANGTRQNHAVKRLG